MHIEAEANLSALIESTEDLIWSVDLENRLVTFNSALRRHLEKTFGTRPRAGMLPKDLVPSDRADLMPPLYERARLEGSVRVELLLPSGRIFDLALSTILADGAVTGVCVFGKDITERKSAEKALREAEEKYRNLFDGALEGIFQATPEGELQTANPALARMLGYDSPEHLLSIGEEDVRATFEDQRERLRCLSILEEQGSCLGFECQLKRRDGGRIWAVVNARKVFGADGKLTGYQGFIIDITERKRMEQAQREDLNLLRETQIVGALGNYVHDITAGMWTSSDALDEFFGIGKDYVRSVAGWAALIHPDDRAMMNAYFAEEVLGKGKTFDKEYRIVRQTDGAVFWVHGMGRLDFDTQGKPLRMSGIIKDITERKRAELALAASEHRFRTFFEENGSVMFLADPMTGEIVAANRAACEFYGYPREKLVGMLTTQINVSPAEDCLRDRLRALHGECSCFYYSHRLAGGEIREIELHSSPFEVDGRQLLYAIVNDITDRKRAEVERRNREEHYRSTFEQAAVGIIHATFKGIVLRCNAHFAEMIGYHAEELTGLDVQQITFPADGPASKEALERVLSSSAPVSFEKRYVRKDGTLTWAKLTISIQRDGEGRPLYFTGLIEDINARKAAEELLASAAEALRLGEERYRTVFDTSPNAIVVSRLADGVVVEANRTYLDAAGYTRDQVIGRTTMELGVWANAADRQRLIDLLLKNNECRDVDFQSVRRSGGLFWMRISASLIEIAGDKCIVAFAQDISEEKSSSDRLAAAANAVRLSEERYRTVFQTCPDSVMIVRVHDSVVLDVNQAFLDSSGFERGEVIGRTSLDLGIWVNESDRQALVGELMRKGQCRDLEVLSRRKNGEIFWMRLSSSLIEIEGEQCRLTFAKEITEVKAAEERLASATEALLASEERYRTVFHTSLDCITLSHLSDGRYIDVNKAFLELIGIEAEEIIGRTSSELGIWADSGARAEIVELLRRNSSFRDYQTQFVKKNGEKIWVLISAAVIEIAGIPCIVSAVRDMSGAKAAESTIHSLALYDPLTGLPNRRLLFEKLTQTLADEEQTGGLKALLLIDIDNLKTLNDTLGHHIGDLLLQEVARRIATCAHESDTVGRLGGDEFVMILDGLSEVAEEAANQARAFGQETLAVISQPYLLENRECLTAASMGVTIFGDKEKTADEILQKADIALHLAKADGRNTLRFFSPALQAVVNAQAMLEKELRQAIKSKQFLLYYQPQAERGRMTGAEALIRWRHPTRGIVLPDEFIPIAEESRLILPMGDWVLEAACRQIALWANRPEAARLTISVNISALQFRQPEFVEHVLAAVERTGADPSRLKLELTESMLVDNIEDVIAKMTELRSHGLSFSLDDFGTGYSSLTYLKRLPLDQLKIDRSFVRDMLVDLTSGAIAQTIISLGRAMELSVVAEGVETEEQRGFLAGLGCHCFQGHLFSPALPPDEFEAFL